MADVGWGSRAWEETETVSDSVVCPSCGASNPAPASEAPFFCRQCKAIVGQKKRAAFVPDAMEDPEARASGHGRSAPPPSELQEAAGAVRSGHPEAIHGTGFQSAAALPVEVATARSHRAPGDAPEARHQDTIYSSKGPSGAPAPVPSQYVSRYGTQMPQVTSGPGTKFSVGGSMFVGFTLCAVVGVLVAFGLGWFSSHVAAAPIVYPFVIGWLIKRSLAAGSGGGTPDRGFVGGAALVLVILAAFVAFRYAEYQSAATQGTDRFRATYGTSATGALVDPEGTMRALHARDPDGDRRVTLLDGTVVETDKAAEQLVKAKATGKSPSDGYDVELLAACGHAGFRGHLEMQATDGMTLRLTPRSKGIEVPGFGVVLIWFAEITIILLTAVGRID